MKLGSFEALVRALDGASARYIVAGGLAVNAHGYLRFTRDVDLVLQLSSENIEAAFSALAGIGYLPIVPITATDFADPGKRGTWAREKGMTVLNFWSERRAQDRIDIDYLRKLADGSR